MIGEVQCCVCEEVFAEFELEQCEECSGMACAGCTSGERCTDCVDLNDEYSHDPTTLEVTNCDKCPFLVNDAKLGCSHSEAPTGLDIDVSEVPTLCPLRRAAVLVYTIAE